MQQKWPILTKIDDQNFTTCLSQLSFYVYGMMFHIFKSIKSAGITERTGGLAILKKDKD